MLLLSPLILELQPERICVINICISFSGDTDKELLENFYFLVKHNSSKLF